MALWGVLMSVKLFDTNNLTKNTLFLCHGLNLYCLTRLALAFIVDWINYVTSIFVCVHFFYNLAVIIAAVYGWCQYDVVVCQRHGHQGVAALRAALQ